MLKNDPQCGRGVVESLLKLVERYDIPATWAVVGHLFLGHGEGRDWISKEMPQFKEGWIDWDFYCQTIQNSLLYCAPDIITRILASSATQEVGLHSFSHIPFSLCSEEVAKLEVKLGLDLARKWDIIPRSFVFPGNYVGHVPILADHGIEIYRGEDAGHYKENATLLIRKASGAIDKIMAPPVLPMWRGGIWEIPGSMEFCDPQLPLSVLFRAKIGLERAMRTNKVFHVWLHPWSLLLYDDLVKDLETFLALVAQKRDQGKLKVMTMKSLAHEAAKQKREIAEESPHLQLHREIERK